MANNRPRALFSGCLRPRPLARCYRTQFNSAQLRGFASHQFSSVQFSAIFLQKQQLSAAAAAPRGLICGRRANFRALPMRKVITHRQTDRQTDEQERTKRAQRLGSSRPPGRRGHFHCHSAEPSQLSECSQRARPALAPSPSVPSGEPTSGPCIAQSRASGHSIKGGPHAWRGLFGLLPFSSAQLNQVNRTALDWTGLRWSRGNELASRPKGPQVGRSSDVLIARRQLDAGSGPAGEWPPARNYRARGICAPRLAQAH